MLKQAYAITLSNLAALPQRWGISIVVIIGVAGVVAVLTSVMAMALGLLDASAKSARDGWAIVLRNGAFAESVSAIPRDALVAIESAPGIARDASGRRDLDLHFPWRRLRQRQDLDGAAESAFGTGVDQDRRPVGPRDPDDEIG